MYAQKIKPAHRLLVVLIPTHVTGVTLMKINAVTLLTALRMS